MRRVDSHKFWFVAVVLFISSGFVWGARILDSTTPELIKQMRAEHWAFQPITKPELSEVKNADWVKTPIDRFVLARLEEAGLAPSKQADRRTLIRRIYFDLIGLPPTYEQVQAFVNDKSPDAWAKVVDELLASPRYGERWGRHWLDVARYSDTSGYVPGGADNRFPFAWTYRDYVIRAFNNDKPYNQFIREQLAADQLGLADNDPALAALGFLTVGRRGRTHDEIDDRIDVVTRGLMALTVSCARCHDHKYDPIPTTDFYALFGVFASSHEPEFGPKIGEPKDTPETRDFKAERDKRQKAIDDYLEDRRVGIAQEVRDRIDLYIAHLARLSPKHKVDHVPSSGVSGKLRARIVREWKRYLERTGKKWHPVWGAWHLLADLEREGFAEKAKALIDRLDEIEKERGPINPLIAQALRSSAPKSMLEVAAIYGELFKQADKQWQEVSKPGDGKPAVTALDHAPMEQIRQELYGKDSPSYLATAAEARRFLGQGERGELRKRETKLKRLHIEHSGAPPRAMVMLDDKRPHNVPVFIRGNPGARGDIVKRRFISVLAPIVGVKEFSNERSGRLELAEAIVHPKNPLTTRVIVNRVWHHHFGFGLVRTPSDFGMRSDPPSHPQLLDWLASTFMEEGWSIKKLHRKIVMSATYQQASDIRAEAAKRDPENLLLWRMNRQRLEWEPLRDSALAVAGRLDLTMFGRPVRMFKNPLPRRRAVYGFIDRHDMPGTLANFDFASPDATSPHRPNTTVPQQNLFMMNSDFVVEQAKHLVARPAVKDAKDLKAKVTAIYRLVLSRDPSDSETKMSLNFIRDEQEAGQDDGELPVLTRYAQALMMSNEFVFVD